MNLINRIKRSRRLGLIATAAVIPGAIAAIALTPAAPALASANVIRPAITYSSLVYTQPGRPAAYAICETSCGQYATIYPNNDTGAHMVCWIDSNNYDGNYTSNKWFYVDLSGWPGEWFIHSSYIYYQTSVPEC